MRDAIDFVDNFLQHEYDPVKAHQYYLRNRELKGRKAAAAAKPVNPGSKVSFTGDPLPKLGTRMEEDQSPTVSPNGAKLSAYGGDAKGGRFDMGLAEYKDGTVYDAKTGWHANIAAARAAGGKASAKPAAKKSSATATRQQRAARVEQKLRRARRLANRIKNQQRRRDVLRRLKNAERKLQTVRRKYDAKDRPMLRRMEGV